MHTFAKKPKATQQTPSAKSPKPSRSSVGQNQHVQSILQLQRTIGNQAVLRLLHEDNHLENQIKTALETPHIGPIHSEEGAIQETAPNTNTGKSLSLDARAAIEARFGYDFSRVRVHTNSQTAAALGAKAFTSGQHIFFRPGRNPSDRSLLTHEIAHVVQQATGEANALQWAAGNESVRKTLENRAEHHSRRIDQETYKPIRPFPPPSLAATVLQFDFEEDVLRELHRLHSPAQEGLAEGEQRRRMDVITRRRARLRGLFNSLSEEDARRYHQRLRIRQRGDALSERFHDILATATRRELLSILESKFPTRQREESEAEVAEEPVAEESAEREETEEEQTSVPETPRPEEHVTAPRPAVETETPAETPESEEREVVYQSTRQLLAAFITGTRLYDLLGEPLHGPLRQVFGPSHPWTQSMQQHPHMASVRENIRGQVELYCSQCRQAEAGVPPSQPVQLNGRDDFSLNTLSLSETARWLGADILSWMSWGTLGQESAWLFGSFRLFWAIRNPNCAGGNAEVIFVAWDTLHLGSATRIPLTDIGLEDQPLGAGMPLNNVPVFWYWRERLTDS